MGHGWGWAVEPSGCRAARARARAVVGLRDKAGRVARLAALKAMICSQRGSGSPRARRSSRRHVVELEVCGGAARRGRPAREADSGRGGGTRGRRFPARMRWAGRALLDREVAGQAVAGG